MTINEEAPKAQRDYARTNWMFTINNWKDDQKCISEDMCQYLVLGKEVGAKGTPHIQGFCVLKEKLSHKAMRLMIPGADIRPTLKSASSNAAYCKKGEQSHDEWDKLKTEGPNYGKNADFFEAGSLPDYKKNSKLGGEATKKKWDQVWDQAKSNQVESIEKKILIPHYRTVKQIAKDYQIAPPDLAKPCGVWFYGEPDTGKSHAARQQFPNCYDKPCNKWWDGYQNEEFVLIDDFDLNHKVLGHHLKRWTDRYSFPAESKGSTFQIRPKKVIVTSNYSISAIFGDDEVLTQALLKRFEVTHFHERKWWKKKKSNGKEIARKMPRTKEFMTPSPSSLDSPQASQEPILRSQNQLNKFMMGEIELFDDEGEPNFNVVYRSPTLDDDVLEENKC